LRHSSTSWKIAGSVPDSVIGIDIILLATLVTGIYPGDLSIYLKSRPLTQVQSLNYLAIILDKKLTFKDHINYITDKCS